MPANALKVVEVFARFPNYLHRLSEISMRVNVGTDSIDHYVADVVNAIPLRVRQGFGEYREGSFVGFLHRDILTNNRLTHIHYQLDTSIPMERIG